MHCSLVPKIAWMRFDPSRAAQPDPGLCLLHAAKPTSVN